MNTVASDRLQHSSQAPTPSPATLIERARAMRPQLRAERVENARRGSYSPELHQQFLEAGFYQISAPRGFGGYEHDLVTFFRTMLEVAIGDPGVGWCLTLAASHAWFVASHWPEQAQREFFAAGVFIAPHRATPGGKLTPVDGGFRLSGTWDYASGVPHATHFIGNAAVVGTAGAPKVMSVVVPRGAYTILDDWGGDRTIGMCASGSHSVRIDDVFVPAHHAIETACYFMRAADMANGTPGTRLHGNSMYLGRVAGPYHLAIATQAVGAAYASIDEFRQTITTRNTLHPPFILRSHHADIQRTLGTALILADTAQAILVRSAEMYMELCERWQRDGTPITAEDNLRLWGVSQQAGRFATEAIDLLFHNGMTSSTTRKGSPVIGYYGDMLMYRSHPASGTDMIATPLARAYLDLPIGFMGL